MSDTTTDTGPDTLRVSRWRASSPSTPAKGSGPRGALARARAWLEGHKPAAAIGGVAAVGAFALYRSHSGATGSGGSPTATDAGTAPSVAGYATGPANAQLLRQLERRNNSLQSQLAEALTRPRGPRLHPPTPAPRPGTTHYLIRHGDTLATIARRVFGTSAEWAVRAIRHANPALRTFGDHAGLGYFAGHTIRVPKPVRPRLPHPAGSVLPHKGRKGKGRTFHHSPHPHEGHNHPHEGQGHTGAPHRDRHPHQGAQAGQRARHRTDQAAATVHRHRRPQG